MSLEEICVGHLLQQQWHCSRLPEQHKRKLVVQVLIASGVVRIEHCCRTEVAISLGYTFSDLVQATFSRNFFMIHIYLNSTCFFLFFFILPQCK